LAHAGWICEPIQAASAAATAMPANRRIAPSSSRARRSATSTATASSGVA
jgi:hypothetical protein